jgi:hypothetical protein
MHLPNLMMLIGTHAEELTRQLVADVRSNPRTTFLHAISPERLRVGSFEIYQHLDHWLANKDEGEIAKLFREVGSHRCHDQVPLREAVYSVILVKQHLLAYIRRNDLVESAVEMAERSDLWLLIDQFFDKAIYHMVAGYEAVQLELLMARMRA